MAQRQHGSAEATTKRRTWSIPVPDDDVGAFGAMCAALRIPFALGGAVRIRSWRGDHRVRSGRKFIFARREDLECILEREAAMAAGGID